MHFSQTCNLPIDNGIKVRYNKGTTKKQHRQQAKVLKTERRKKHMKKFTGIVVNEKTINTAEYLMHIYPEQDRLINELLDCITYGIACREDACTYIHGINAVMTKLFNAIDNEAFDDRDVSDAEYAEIITEIKEIFTHLDGFINDYINELIYTFGIDE